MRVMGLMSGTSADGIDVAVADIDGAPVDAGGAGLRVRQVGFVAVAWPEERRRLIFDLFANQAPPAELCRANFTLGETFAQAVHSALAELGLPLATVDLIGSHGQTIWHDVADGRVTSTLQIGEPAVIAARTGVTTVADFRVADVAEGGQGAPLVSAFDWHLLRPAADAGGWRAVQNIGGIGNVTFLPPLGLDAPPLAFDTGPGNALIDWSAGEATGGVWTFDQDGELASEGRVIERLLARWLEHPFYRRAAAQDHRARAVQRRPGAAVAGGGVCCRGRPPGVGGYAHRTDRGLHRRRVRPLCAGAGGGGGGRRRRRAQPRADGRHRPAVAGAAGLFAPVALTTHEALGIDSDAKEALAFALLAYLCWHGWPGNVPTCTGAHRPAFLGQIAPGGKLPAAAGHAVDVLSRRQHPATPGSQLRPRRAAMTASRVVVSSQPASSLQISSASACACSRFKLRLETSSDANTIRRLRRLRRFDVCHLRKSAQSADERLALPSAEHRSQNSCFRSS
jgi:anhydro-N-acetylmuramic acid kinase